MLPRDSRLRALVLLGGFLTSLTVSALDSRVANTTLPTAIPLDPPVYGYQAPNAFGALTFTRPVAL